MAETLGDSAALDLAHDFRAYKLDPTNQAGINFGRDKTCLFPDVIAKNGIRHVHMAEASVESYWQSIWDRNGSHYDYTSDKLLIYGGLPDPDFPEHLIPIMLLDILSPTGHKMLGDFKGMEAIGEMFLEEVSAYSVRLPSHKWIHTK